MTRSKRTRSRTHWIAASLIRTECARKREKEKRERRRNGDGDGVSGNLGFETTGFCTSTRRARERERERGEKKGVS